MTMREIYLNHAATSPRPSDTVRDAVIAYLREGGHASPGRNFEGLEDAQRALDARLAVGALFGVTHPSRVVFTPGATASLNMLLHGAIRRGDHVLTTSVEHNAVARPLALLEKQGVITVTRMRCAPDGTLDPAQVEQSLRPNSRLLVMTHASNVLGTILPFRECFAAAKRRGLFTVLDAAQTAGCIPLRMEPDMDAVAFAGHKGLGGLAGTGGFVLGKDSADRLEPWLVGGTGSASDSLEQPAFLPDKFEPGTPNTVGIVSLGAAAEELLAVGVDAVRRRAQSLTERFIAAASRLPVAVCGTGDAAKSVPVVSLAVADADPGILAGRLYREHGVLIRSGLHCAPLAHETAGTFPRGTLRFSFGRGTTEEDIDAAVSALDRVLAEEQKGMFVCREHG